MRSEEEQASFNDRLDVLKHVSDIKLRLKEDITNDFVLARMGDKDKEFIIEMTGNAYYAKKLIDIIRDKGETWVWEKGEYKRIALSKEDKEKISRIGKAIFDSYMIKIYMIVILNRNVDKNYLINVLSGYLEKDEQGVEVIGKEDEISSKLKNLLAESDKSKKEK